MTVNTRDEQLATMQAHLDGLRAQRAALDDEIARFEGAVRALHGDFSRLNNGRSATAGKAIMAALATFKSPVRTEQLLDHDSLVHYSRHTLRSALSELHKQGSITGTRAPKGYIWEPL